MAKRTSKAVVKDTITEEAIPSTTTEAVTSSFGSKLAGKFSFGSSGPPTGSKPAGIVKPKAQARSTPKVRKPKASSKYADPSTYAHLPQTLPDCITENLLVLLVGHNPGVQTATAQHAYAHRSNRFWPLLHLSGLTPDRQVPCEEDRTLPAKYSLGNTNIVSRPTRDTAELSLTEQAEGTPALEEKVKKYRPESVACVGKSVWEAVFRHWNGRALKKADNFKYGWQYDASGKEVRMGKDGAWPGARVFAAPSTSGLAAGMSMDEKIAVFKELGDWVNSRRAERKEAAGATADDGDE